MLEGEFPTPEEAVLAEWVLYPQAEARVLRVEYLDDARRCRHRHDAVASDVDYSERTVNAGWVLTDNHN